MLSFQGVYKTYPGSYDALRGVSFSVAPGEMVFLTGPSGAGKTTLLKLLAAMERPTQGSVVVCGEDVGRMPARAVPYLRRNLGLIFQDQKLLFDRSVLENVMLPLQVAGFSYADCASRARAALDKVGLLERDRANPIALSGGEQQRLCIARAVVARPNLLLADEPTINLDTAYARRILELFESFHQVGVTVLIATHDDSLIEQLGGRIVHLEAGQVVT